MGKSAHKTDWTLVPDSDIPVKRVGSLAARRKSRTEGRYFVRVPVDPPADEALKLGGMCFVIYGLIATAEAVHPRQDWHPLPPAQAKALGLSRHQVKRAVRKLEAAGIVEVKRRRGCKTLYRRNLKPNGSHAAPA